MDCQNVLLDLQPCQIGLPGLLCQAAFYKSETNSFCIITSFLVPPTPTPQPATGTLLVRKVCVTFEGFGCLTAHIT